MDVREKLIEICFREFCDLAGDSPCGCDGCPYGEYDHDNGGCYVEYKKGKIEKLENYMDKYHGEDNGVTVQEWIPVRDRLPDEHESLFARYKGTDKWRNAMFTTISDRVIVCAEYENGKRIVKTANTVDGVWKVKDIFCPCKVTHWMPLPEPQKGE